MNPVRLMTQTVIVTHRTQNDAVRDEMGNPTITTTTHSFRGAVQQRARDEDTANTNTQASRSILLLEPKAAGVVDGADAITVDGLGYELDGPPWPAYNPRLRRVTHVEADVRRTV